MMILATHPQDETRNIRDEKGKWQIAKDRTLILLGIIISLIFFYYLFFYRAPAPDTSEFPPIGVLHNKKTVEMRHGNSILWSDKSGTSTIYLNDLLYVPLGSEATVTISKAEDLGVPENTEFYLPGGTFARFDAVGLSSLSFTLWDTPQFWMAPFYSYDLLPLPDPTPLKQAAEALTADLIPLLSHELHLKPINSHLISMLPLDRLVYYSIILFYPAHGASFIQSSRWLETAWSYIPLPGTQVVVSISRDRHFYRELFYQTHHGNNIILLQFSSRGTYYWKVTASYHGEKIESAPSFFSVSAHKGIAKTGVPESAKTLTNQGYMIEIAKDNDFKELLRNEISPTSDCPTSGLAPGEYYCRYRALGPTAKTPEIKKIKIPSLRR